MKTAECYRGRAIATNQIVLGSAPRTANGTGDAALLEGFSALTFQLDVTAAPAPVYSASVAAGADDGQHETGALTTNATTIKVGRPIGSAADNSGIVRFDGVAIPSGATILSATLTLRRTAADAGTVPVTIALIDADDADFPADAAAFEGASLTSGTADTITGGSNGEDWISADFASDAQTVIDRGGWDSGQALVVAVSGDGGDPDAFATFAAFEHSTAPQAILTVTYQSDALDVYLQTTVDGTNWVDVARFHQVLGDGNAKRYISKLVCDAALTEFENATGLAEGATRAIFGDRFRARWVITDGGSGAPTFTFSVTANGT